MSENSICFIVAVLMLSTKVWKIRTIQRCIGTASFCQRKELSTSTTSQHQRLLELPWNWFVSQNSSATRFFSPWPSTFFVSLLLLVGSKSLGHLWESYLQVKSGIRQCEEIRHPRIPVWRKLRVVPADFHYQCHILSFLSAHNAFW